jgi:tripartite-type tricarboxylate transporter receptor subunit TctC
MERFVKVIAHRLAMKISQCIALCVVAVVSIACAYAQTWPAKPVRIVVPFAPGGLADTLGRIVAHRLSESFGQSFIIDNRAGAGGVTGSEQIARSAPDGYLLLVSGVGSHVVAPALSAKPPYDPLRDFTHIALLGGTPSVLAVHPAVQARNLPEFIALARAMPGAMSYGSPGNGSQGQTVVEMLKRATGINLIHVPYKGASGAVSDLIAGHIQAVSTTFSTAGAQIRAGRVRALAISAAARLADYPDLPTFREQGYPALVVTTWFALSAPAGLPGEIVTKLNAEVRRILQLPDTRERLRPEGIEPGTLDAPAFTEFVSAEITRWAPVVRASGARVE